MDLNEVLKHYREQMRLALLLKESKISTETNNLMSEIEAFHFQNALNKSLDERDHVAFLKLTDMEENKCLLN